MASITETANLVFRDSEEVGTSERHKVVKAEVRALMAQVDTEIQAAQDAADGLVFVGDYSGATTYSVGQAVSYDGGSYVSRVDNNLNHTPDSSPTQWQQLAAPGTPGSATSSSTVAWSGVLTPSQITSDQNDYNPSGWSGATIMRLSSDAVRSITGVAVNSIPWRIIVLRNVGSFDIKLLAQNFSSNSNLRFAFLDDIVLRAGGPDVVIQYDSTLTRWRLHANSRIEGYMEPATSIAAASTTDIGASLTERVTITSGAGTIGNFGTRPKQKRWVYFSVAVALTHSSALSLIGGVTRQVPAGSSGFWASDASGNWLELSYTAANTLSKIASIESDILEIEDAVADLEAATPGSLDDSVDPLGVVQFSQSAEGRDAMKVVRSGETIFPDSENVPIPYFDDADSGKFKVLGDAYAAPATLLPAALANTIRRPAGGAPHFMQRVEGGWRVPYNLKGIASSSSLHIGRIGNGVICPDNGRTIYAFLFIGQSNHGGDNEGGELLRITHPFPQKLLMPKTLNPDDIRLFLDQANDEALPSYMITGFTSLRGSHSFPGATSSSGTAQSEIAMSTLATLIGDAFDGWCPYLCGFTIWKGGTPVEDMEPGGGSNVNANARIAIASIIREAREFGYNVNFIGAVIDQGEQSTGNSTLADQWVDIIAGFTTYARGLNGQVNDIVPLVNQTSSFGTATGEKTKVDRYIADGAIIPAAPRYMIGEAQWKDDYLHMTRVGHFYLGELVGHALFQQFCKGGWTPLLPVSGVISGGGTTVTVTFNEPVLLNTTLVESVSQSGLRVHTNSGGLTEIAINAVNVVGGNLVLTLASPLISGTNPAPILSLGTAGQTGPRTAAAIPRTNVAAVATLGFSQLDGRPIKKWALHQTITLTY